MRTVTLTEDDLAILSAYTLYQFVPKFSQVHEKIEELLGRPVNTIEFMLEEVQKEIKGKCKPEYDRVIAKIEKQLQEEQENE